MINRCSYTYTCIDSLFNSGCVRRRFRQDDSCGHPWMEENGVPNILRNAAPLRLVSNVNEFKSKDMPWLDAVPCIWKRNRTCLCLVFYCLLYPLRKYTETSNVMDESSCSSQNTWRAFWRLPLTTQTVQLKRMTFFFHGNISDSISSSWKQHNNPFDPTFIFLKIGCSSSDTTMVIPTSIATLQIEQQ